MKLGKLDTFIELIRNVKTGVNEFNEPVYEDVAVESGWAERVQTAGREFLSGDAVQATHRVVFRTHWIPGVLMTDRVRANGVDHNIQEARPLGRDLYLELHTVAVAP